MLERINIKFDRLCQIPRNRRMLRSMIFGYYVDENGLATDAKGKSLGEHFPGEFMETTEDAAKLVYCETPGILMNIPFDEGRFVDLVDENGAPALRVDVLADEQISRFITQFDVPRGEGINELYAILACKKSPNFRRNSLRPLDLANALRRIKDDPYVKVPYYQDQVYLDRIINGQIRDAGMLNLAKLRGIVRNADTMKFLEHTTTAQIKQLTYMFNPKNWEQAFPMKSIMGWNGSEGQIILPMQYSETKQLEVIDEDGTAVYENFLLAASQLIIIPAVEKVTRMLSFFERAALAPAIAKFSDERVEAWRNLMKLLNSWQPKDRPGLKWLKRPQLVKYSHGWLNMFGYVNS